MAGGKRKQGALRGDWQKIYLASKLDPELVLDIARKKFERPKTQDHLFGESLLSDSCLSLHGALLPLLKSESLEDRRFGVHAVTLNRNHLSYSIRMLDNEDGSAQMHVKVDEALMEMITGEPSDEIAADALDALSASYRDHSEITNGLQGLLVAGGSSARTRSRICDALSRTGIDHEETEYVSPILTGMPSTHRWQPRSHFKAIRPNTLTTTGTKTGLLPLRCWLRWDPRGTVHYLISFATNPGRSAERPSLPFAVKPSTFDRCVSSTPPMRDSVIGTI